ncbi:MAG: hypothetical protein D6721_00515 [Gammaproteobacteria bacterium]|nr:MAG: hypothetical protein D6721_00515 [Gammaproteobacteria bacterium]
MYRQHFGLQGKPFSIAPDPRFLYLSERHREALAHLLFGLGEGGGFVQLTGEVGTGKTTLCRALLEQLPDEVDVVLVFNPRVDAFELVKGICDELGVAYPPGTHRLKVLVDALNAHLIAAHARGRRTVLIIDEAQNLDRDVLEQVRLLTNLETAEEKLLQILLIGQPELKTLLARDDLRQLEQRITARYHLDPLGPEETRAYVRHRLRVCQGDVDLFTPRALDLVHRYSGGIPRLINVLCDRALLGAYVEDKRRVDAAIVRRAAAEVLPGARPSSAASARRPWRAWLAGGIGAAAVGLAVLGGGYLRPSGQPAASRPAVSAAGTERPEAAPPAGPAAVAGTPRGARPAPGPAAPAHGERARAAAAAPATRAGDAGREVPLAERIRRLDYGDTLAAWQRLFRRWGARFVLDSPQSPCEQARAQGLRCLVLRGNWHRLRAFDRPALLDLVRADGTHARVLISRWPARGQPEVVLGTEHRRLPPEALERWWFGDFVLLWRPRTQRDLLRPGDHGRDVLWVRRQLARALGTEVLEAPDPLRFDARLSAAVRRFQAAGGLHPDGIIGAQTLIRLNSLDPDFTGPRLDAPET